MREAVFCTLWSLALFVLEVFGNQMGAAYMKRERIEALYVVIRDSFRWPHVVPASAFSSRLTLSKFFHVGAEGKCWVDYD